MRVISIQQPWAWAIVHGPKRVENRTWGTPYRGPLLIHAGRSRERLGDYGEGEPAPADLVYGAAIGLAQDALTGRPIGVNGMAKSVIGYIASSIGVQVDVDNLTTRVVMNFGFSLLNSLILFLITFIVLAVARYMLMRIERRIG